MSPTQKEMDSIAGKSTDNMDTTLNKSGSIESSDGHNTSGVSNSEKSPKKKKMKSSKVKKDPNKPEYPKVGYVRYMNVRREELRRDFPDMHHLEVTKKIGEEWMALSDEKKQPYLDAAKQDKIRYKLEMKAYNKKMRKAEQESASPSKSKKKSKAAKDADTSVSTVDESPKKKKKKIMHTTDEHQKNDLDSESSQKTKSQNATKKAEKQPAVSSISLVNTPSPTPTPTQIDSTGAPIFGDIPIFTDKFLEHNRQMETELKKIRKMNTDYEQQNAVLEKHVENVQIGINKTNDEITEIQTQNEKLEAYLNALRQRLATQLRNLSIPSEPNGANIDNIDKYMNDLVEMAKDNSHGPASLNKAKDLLRKVDLNFKI